MDLCECGKPVYVFDVKMAKTRVICKYCITCLGKIGWFGDSQVLREEKL